jgi:hypothetical protein
MKDYAMDIKPRPNHTRYVAVLRRMTPAQRLEKSFELTQLARELMKDGLRKQQPNASAEALHGLYLERIRRCRSENS